MNTSFKFILLAAAASLALAQNAVTVPLTPQFAYDQTPFVDGLTITPDIGKITYTFPGISTITVSVQGPATVTGTDTPVAFGFAQTTNFTLSVSETNLQPNVTGFTNYSVELLDLYGVRYCSLSSPATSVPCPGAGIDHINGAGSPLGMQMKLSSTGEFTAQFLWTIAAAAPQNALGIDGLFPLRTEPLLAIEPDLPAFCAFGKYSYSGPNSVNVILQLFDENGKSIARSGIDPRFGDNRPLGKPVNFPAGSNLDWGGSCKSTTQLVFTSSNFPMPQVGYEPSTPYDQKVATYNLQAFLVDSVTNEQLANSIQIPFIVVPGVAAKSQLYVRGVKDPAPGSLVDPSKPIERFAKLIIQTDKNGDDSIVFGNADLAAAVQTTASGKHSGQLSNYVLTLHVALDLAGHSGQLNALVQYQDTTGALIPGGSKSAAQAVSQGHSEVDLQVQAVIPSGAANVFIAPHLVLDNGADLKLDPINLTIGSIKIAQTTPDPRLCDLVASPQNCPVNSGSMTIQSTVAFNPAVAGETYFTSAVSVPLKSTGQANINLQLDPPPAPGTFSAYQESVPLTVNDSSNILQLLVGYQAQAPNYAFEVIQYKDFASPAANLVSGAANQAFQFIDGAASGVFSAATRQVAVLAKKAQMVAPLMKAAVSSGGASRYRRSAAAIPSQSAAAGNAPFLSIDRTWQFDPPIPHDGSFSANLTLNYHALQLPDDPNFIEAQIQIVSIDPSGALHMYPTTLDTVNKVATAPIDGLDPYFTVAVIGPFAQPSAMFAAPASSFVVVNTGGQNSNLGLSAYAGDPTIAPATPVLPMGTAQTQSMSSDWVQVWADQPTVTGVSWFDNGSQFFVNPAQSPGQAFLYTDVEYDNAKTTQIDLANTTPFDTSYTISLFNPDGSSQGTYTGIIGPKDTVHGNIQDLFPGLTNGFIGYAIVTARETVAASGALRLNTAATGIVAQPLVGPSTAPTIWYAPQPAATSVTATLHLVNTAGTTANITLKAWSSSGSAAAANVTMQLSPGQQFAGTTSSIFGIDPSIVPTVEVDSDTAGVFGDLLTADSTFYPNYLASIPLCGQPAASTVLPYAGPTTRVSVFNPNPTPTTVTVTPFGPDGTPGTASSVQVPANGQSVASVSSTGYVSVGSAQPVVASGWVDVRPGTTTGYLAIPSTGAPVGPAAAPSISVTPNPFDFQSVAINQSKSQTFTIANTGTADLHLTDIQVTGDPSFTLSAPFSPVTVKAGDAPASVTVIFKPTQAAAINGQLSIKSDDPTQQPNVSIPLKGTGVSSSFGTISVTVPTMDFGTVNVNSTYEITVTIANIGSGVLSVTPSFSPNPPFSVVSPAGPLSINAGTSQPLKLRFSPASAGPQSATLTLVTTDSTNQTVTYQFTGIGAASTGGGGSGGGSGTITKIKLEGGSYNTNSGVFTPTPLPNPAKGCEQGQCASFDTDPATTNFALGVATSVTGSLLNASNKSLPSIGLQPGSYYTFNQPAYSWSGGARLTVTWSNGGSDVAYFAFGGFDNQNNPAPWQRLGGSTDLSITGQPVTTQCKVEGISTAPSGCPVNNEVELINIGSSSGSGGSGSPTANVSIAATDFGSVNINSTGTLTVTIANSGGTTLSVTPAISPNPVFSTSPASALSINAGTSQPLTLRFTPAASGPQIATLKLTTNDPAHPTLMYQFTGTGASSTGGGSSGSGGPTTTNLTVTGTGTSSVGNLSVSGSLSLSGIGTGTFSSSFTLASAAASGSVPVTLTITNGNPTGTLTGILTGSPTLLAQVFAGNPSATGTATITISSGTGGFTGASATFNVTASGTGAGTTGSGAGSFSLTGPGTLNLPGSGGGGTPAANVTVANTNFGTVNINSTGTLPITIANTGTSTLSVTPNITLGPIFTTSPATALSINAGTSQTLNVNFTPAVAGTQSATLTLATNDLNHPTVTYQFTGTGAASTGGGGSGGGSGAITKIKLEGGSYNTNSSVFTPTPLPNPAKGCEQGQCATFDTDPATTNFALGVATSISGSLLNPASKALPAAGLQPGSYYTFNQPAYSWSGGARLTVTWSNGASDVAYFAFGGFNNQNNPAPWQHLGGATNLSITGQPVTTQCKVEGTSTAPSGCPVNNEVELINISSSSGSGAGGGGTPAANITVANTNFGTVNINSTGTLPVTIANTGTATLSVTPNITSGPVFSTSPATALSINAGTSQTLNVKFTPATTGSQTATLTLTTNDPNHQTLTYQFSGVGGSSGSGGSGSGGTSNCDPLPANLVSWWKGDGTANDSNGANNGNLQGGASYATGEVGQTFQFDGSTGYVSIGNPSNLRFTSAMTVEGWINPKAAPPASGASSGTNMAAVLTKWGQQFNPTSDADSYGLWFRNNAGSLTMFTALHLGGTSEPNLQGGAIPLNAWTHVAMTYDGSSGNYILYVNGQVVASANAPGTIAASTRNVFMGREDSAIPRPFNGLIDEVSVYSRALSASEIQSIASAGSAGKCTSAGSGGGSTPTSAVLKVDGGAFNVELGYPAGASTAYFVNRLTPTSYPATLTAVQVYFSSRTDGVPLNTPILIFTGSNPGGTSNLSFGSAPVYYSSTVVAHDTFVTYRLSNALTITSGDFVVGYEVANPAGYYPADLDQLSPSQTRSYISTDGLTFTLVDTIPGLAGNLGIRAVVTVGGK